MNRATDSPAGAMVQESVSLALRLGLRMIKGLGRAGAQRLVEARRQRAFDDTRDLAHRARLSGRDMQALAAAGALASLAGNRHQARWQVLGVEEALPVVGEYRINEAVPLLPRPTEAGDILADYASLGLSLRRHPLALVREQLQSMRFSSAADTRALADGTPVRTAGLVITRQRPSTASGVIFLTMEDETGTVNVIVWRDVQDRQRKTLLGARLLGVSGRLQREGEVIHVVADRLEDHSALIGKLENRSRDFC